MSHKTAYKTFSSTDLIALETQVNDHIKSLKKNELHESIKINDITTFSANGAFVAALTYSYVKKKKPVAGETPAAVTEA